jgi:hypothetical protein
LSRWPKRVEMARSVVGRPNIRDQDKAALRK